MPNAKHKKSILKKSNKFTHTGHITHNILGVHENNCVSLIMCAKSSLSGSPKRVYYCVTPRGWNFPRTSIWATVRRNARALSPAVSAATYCPEVVQVLCPPHRCPCAWRFRGETRCCRPVNASPWRLRSWSWSRASTMIACMCRINKTNAARRKRRSLSDRV